MRTKLCEKYQLEREDICARLISILQLDNNNSFLLCNLDDNIEKNRKSVKESFIQNQIDTIQELIYSTLYKLRFLK